VPVLEAATLPASQRRWGGEEEEEEEGGRGRYRPFPAPLERAIFVEARKEGGFIFASLSPTRSHPKIIPSVGATLEDRLG